MVWEDLLSSKRLGISDELRSDDGRSPYLIDVDRLIYSAHFRKLQDKTQVHPLSKSDFVRTRLTHSLEVGTVARSLGYNVGQHILKKYTNLDLTEHDVGYIVQAAALAHDIGNPPFGHLGEYAMTDYYKQFLDNNNNLEISEKDNLCQFDGNSQGFRIITNLAGWRNQGGLRLTCATLGAFLKYPRGYCSKEELKRIANDSGKFIIGHTKTGVFNTELTNLNTIAKELGLLKLSDTYSVYIGILYHFNRGCRRYMLFYCRFRRCIFVNLIKLEELEEIIIPIARRASKYGKNVTDRINNLRNETFYKELDNRKKVEFLRGKAISNLINGVTESFINYEEKILEASFNQSLLSTTEFASEIVECKKFARKILFTSHHKINAEISGIAVINQVMNELTKLISMPSSILSKLLFNYLDRTLILENASNFFNNKQLSEYEKYVIINDIISDLTDRNILNFSKILKGI